MIHIKIINEKGEELELTLDELRDWINTKEGR